MCKDTPFPNNKQIKHADFLKRVPLSFFLATKSGKIDKHKGQYHRKPARET